MAARNPKLEIMRVRFRFDFFGVSYQNSMKFGTWLEYDVLMIHMHAAISE